MRAWGRVLTTLGALGVLGAVALMVLGALGMSGATAATDVHRPVVTGETVQLRAGDRHLLVAPREASPDAQCRVVGPDDRSLPVAAETYDRRVVGSDVALRGAFTLESSGAHEVDCVGGTVWMTDAVPLGAVLLGLGGTAVGILVGMGSGVMLVVGAVLWLAGHDRAVAGFTRTPGGARPGRHPAPMPPTQTPWGPVDTFAGPSHRSRR